jgi:RNA polymerase sigma-70 factor (ECF subfamily)
MDNGGTGPAASDADLWQLAVGGEHVAFGCLFDRHANAIYNFCLRRTGDRIAAEDLMSETFLHAWRRRADVRLVDDRGLPWLYGIAVNLCRRHLRGTRRHRVALARLPASRPEPECAAVHSS